MEADLGAECLDLGDGTGADAIRRELPEAAGQEVGAAGLGPLDVGVGPVVVGRVHGAGRREQRERETKPRFEHRGL